MKLNEIVITIKPSSHRDMVKHALTTAGFKITGSGYSLMEDEGDLVATPPCGASPDEFGPAIIKTNLPEGLGGPCANS